MPKFWIYRASKSAIVTLAFGFWTCHGSKYAGVTQGYE